MKIQNILILGNGFDLAMGRKTSYQDFLDFIQFIYSIIEFPFLNPEENNKICSFRLYKSKIELDEEEATWLYNMNSIDNEPSDLDCFSEYFVNFFRSYCSNYRATKSSYIVDYYYFIKKYFELLNKKIKVFDLKKDIHEIDEKFEEEFPRKYLEKFTNKINDIWEDIGDEIYEEIYEEIFENEESNELSKENIRLLSNCLFANEGLEDKFNVSENMIIQYLIENKDRLGENWSHIEHNISKLAEGITDFKNGKDNNESYNQFIKKCAKQLKDCDECDECGKCDKDVIIQKINENLSSSLDGLTDLLEYYLTCQEKIDFDNESTRIKKQPSILDKVVDIENSKVLTFNYTNTANEILGIPDENTHFIHGRINSDRKLSPINTMVFGIEDKSDDVDTDLMPYQKYYQRIVKETGNDYEEFFNNDGTHIKNIIIFGHSIDPLDKEIFLNCFELAKKGNYKYKFIVSYYSELDKRSIIKNLVIILGKNEVIDLTRNKKLVFVRSNDCEKFREEIIEFNENPSDAKLRERKEKQFFSSNKI